MFYLSNEPKSYFAEFTPCIQFFTWMGSSQTLNFCCFKRIKFLYIISSSLDVVAFNSKINIIALTYKWF